MEAKRRQTIVLGGLIVVLTMVVWWQFGLPSSVPEPVPAAGQTQKPTAAARGQVAVEVPLVSMALLEQPRSEPIDTGRDLFKFAARSRPADGGATTGKPAGPGGGGAPSPAGPGGPTGAAGTADTPAPPPPIALKFIGLVQKQGDPAKIAVLSDSRGVYHGREGDIIEGRYRIVRIGNESVELVYLDGRGRQVLRLSGA
jgi:hypothetical protein